MCLLGFVCYFTWWFLRFDDNSIDCGPEGKRELGRRYGGGHEQLQRFLAKALEEMRMRKVRGAVGMYGDLSCVSRGLMYQRPWRQCRSRHQHCTVEQHPWNKHTLVEILRTCLNSICRLFWGNKAPTNNSSGFACHAKLSPWMSIIQCTQCI